MERLMPEQRRMIEDFEVIEHVDEKQIANLRKRVDVDVPLSLHWTWEYGSEVEELRQLYERGKKGQWNAETDIDWSIPFPQRPVVPPEARTRRCWPACCTAWAPTTPPAATPRATSSRTRCRSSCTASRPRCSSAASSPTPARPWTRSGTPARRSSTRCATSR